MKGSPTIRGGWTLLKGPFTPCWSAGLVVIACSRSPARKRVNCTLWVGEELVPQVEDVKYVCILFKSEEK